MKEYMYDTTDEGFEYICTAKSVNTKEATEVIVRTTYRAASYDEAALLFEEMLSSDKYEQRRWKITIELMEEVCL